MIRTSEGRWRSRERLRRQVAVAMVVALVATTAGLVYSFRDNDAATAYSTVIAVVALGSVAVFSRMSNHP